MTIKNWHTEHKASLTPGQKAADVLRNGMGSWPFIGTFILSMVLWAVANSIVLKNGSWDPYPYILLNLFLSMLAGLQGAILLISAKRQDAISSAMAKHDYDTNVAAKLEIDRLIDLGEQHKQMIEQLRALVAETSRAALVSEPGAGSGPRLDGPGA
ncbi:DUF1003 domain-containing protein [Pseudarthrobacter sp. P1]|uniref:DUF1003 domain-containing protein n=1 Tax=Pseudarthrobacter sp. P1 TaxID=3418418 RepID=UPI003CECE82D